MKNMKYVIAAMVVAGCVSGDGYAMEAEENGENGFLSLEEIAVIDENLVESEAHFRAQFELFGGAFDTIREELRVSVDDGLAKDAEIKRLQSLLSGKAGEYDALKKILAGIKLGGGMDVDLADGDSGKVAKKLTDLVDRYDFFMRLSIKFSETIKRMKATFGRNGDLMAALNGAGGKILPAQGEGK